MNACCKGWGQCNPDANCPAGNGVAEKLLAGEVLPSIETLDQYAARMERQWHTKARAAFSPLFNEPEQAPDEAADKPLLTLLHLGELLARVGLVISITASFALLATWPSLVAFLNRVFN